MAAYPVDGAPAGSAGYRFGLTRRSPFRNLGTATYDSWPPTPEEDAISKHGSPHVRTSRRLRILAAVISLGVLVAPSSFVPISVAGAAVGSAFVRVNQVGYASHSSKRAYLLSSIAETGATFAVTAGVNTLYSAPIGDELGSWSAGFSHVYALDFSAVGRPGSYTISVNGPVDATSPLFRIAGPGGVYADALANALSFYQVQRDGPNFVPSALRRSAGHLHDRSAMTYLTPKHNSDGEFRGDLSSLGKRIDAAGGWWDAGDYLKFVQTTSYTVDVLLAGVRDFPNQMGAGAARSDFSAEAEFGTRWLLRMWNDRTRTLYYQVGIGSGNAKTLGDHDIWRLPKADDTFGGSRRDSRYIRHRPVFRAGPPGSKVSPNLAGRDAAAFAECFQVFQHSKPALASRCLRAAEDIFALANTKPRGHLLTVIPFDFYPETEWRDDMELGATELYLALASDDDRVGLAHTSPTFYLRRAAHWAKAYMNGPNDATDPLNLYDVSGMAHYELVRAMRSAGHSAGLATTQRALLADMKKQLDRAVVQSESEPFGFGFPWATWDTTSHGAGLSVLASEYDQLTGTHGYAIYANRWLGNILGANAWGISLIVGDGSAFPNCLQHQVANLVGSLDGSSPVLAGAAVEGPNSAGDSGTVDGMKPCPADGVDVYARFNGHGAEFQDNMESFPNTEPAIDLTATSPIAFARQAEGIR